MAVRVSPMVNIYEKDISYIPQAIQEVPYMYVGLYEKGQAFIPKTFNVYGDYVAEHGIPSSDYKISYGVKGRMKQGGNVATTRILGQSGYVATDGWVLTAGTSSDGYILGYIRSNAVLSLGANATVDNFALDVALSSTTAHFTNLSLKNTNTANYVKNNISSIANAPSLSSNTFILKQANSPAKIYIEKLYDYKVNTFSNSASIGIVKVTNTNSYVMPYSNSYSTTIVSQPFNNQVYDLFTVNTISDGKSSIKLKVGISDIDKASGTFSLIVRDWNDTDSSMLPLEIWSGLSLNPTSDKFIAKMIGNSEYLINGDGSYSEIGDYPNKSKYIYLTNINTVLPNGLVIVPGGFKGYVGKKLDSVQTREPNLPIKRNQLVGTSPKNNVWFGIDFTYDGIYDYLLAKPINMADFPSTEVKGFLLAENIETTALSAEFLGINSGNYGSATYNQTTYDSNQTTSYVTANKFIFAVANGFDGFNEEASNDNKLNFLQKLSGTAIVTAPTVELSMGYADVKLAIDAISNPDSVDFKLLFTTGLYQKEAINYALTMVENRADALYIPDLVDPTSEINEIVAENANYDSSYYGVYYPSVKRRDPKNGTYSWIDTSIIMSEIFAYNDKIAFPHSAAAGYTRGVLNNVYTLYKNLNSDQRDYLYNNRINPIATFNANGNTNFVVWGNRTGQVKDSALSDINIRRLLIEARKFVSSVANRLLFEPGDAQLFETFKKTVNPYFEEVKAQRGLIDFRVVMDNTTTTADDLDRNTINGFIVLKPTKAIEVINIGFVITKQSANFDEL